MSLRRFPTISTSGQDVALAPHEIQQAATVGEFSPSRPALGRRLLPLLLLVAASLLFLLFGGHHYLTFAALAENSERVHDFVARAGLTSALCFVVAYAGLTALSVPGAAMLTIAAGFLFGTWLGLLYAVVGATLGATAIFLAARAGLGGLLERAGPRACRLKAALETDAFNYLLVLRLVPIFPFWLVNLVAAVAGMRFRTYVLGTFLGIIPGTFVFVTVGTGMGDIVAASRSPDLSMLFRPSVLAPITGLAVLALIPVLYKRWGGRRDETSPA